jgi:hypothetical protein
VNLIETPNSGCVGALYRYLRKKLTFVGATYATRNGIIMHFSYGKSSGSSLEVGLSVSGDYGSFTADGSTSESTTSEQGMPTTTKASKNWWRTWFSYAEYIEECSDGDLFWTQAYQWDSGDAVSRPRYFPHITGAYCVGELSGSWFKADSTRAASFGAGFTLAAPIGFTGSAQTGWTQEANIKYTWNVNGSSCGSNGFPPYAAILIAR